MTHCVALGKPVHLSGLPPLLSRAGNTGAWFSISFFSLSSNPILSPHMELQDTKQVKAKLLKGASEVSPQNPGALGGRMAEHPMQSILTALEGGPHITPRHGRWHCQEHWECPWIVTKRPQEKQVEGNFILNFWGYCTWVLTPSKKTPSIPAMWFQMCLSGWLERMKRTNSVMPHFQNLWCPALKHWAICPNDIGGSELQNTTGISHHCKLLGAAQSLKHQNWDKSLALFLICTYDMS